MRKPIQEASLQNPAAPNTSIRVSRSEWKIWKSLLDRDPGIRDIATFGDFGADNAKFVFDGGGAPITHLRYAIEEEWIVARGGPPTKIGDGTIRQVAKTILDSGAFAGADFSVGDEKIAAWALGKSPLGGATEWRKANMLHHWTRVLTDTAALRGVRLARKPRRKIPVQGDLFVR
jgi:hypothetical protein